MAFDKLTDLRGRRRFSQRAAAAATKGTGSGGDNLEAYGNWVMLEPAVAEPAVAEPGGTPQAEWDTQVDPGADPESEPESDEPTISLLSEEEEALLSQLEDEAEPSTPATADPPAAPAASAPATSDAVAKLERDLLAIMVELSDLKQELADLRSSGVAAAPAAAAEPAPEPAAAEVAGPAVAEPELPPAADDADRVPTAISLEPVDDEPPPRPPRAQPVQPVQPVQPPGDAAPPEAPTNGEVPDDLQQDMRSVLLYLDQLLDSLPEDKIEEFAQSEHFATYKRLFNRLNLED